jgi:hypothetical protein
MTISLFVASRSSVTGGLTGSSLLIRASSLGQKIALVVVPTCMSIGNRGAATLPFLLAALSLLLGTKGLFHRANITGRFET